MHSSSVCKTLIASVCVLTGRMLFYETVAAGPSYYVTSGRMRTPSKLKTLRTFSTSWKNSSRRPTAQISLLERRVVMYKSISIYLLLKMRKRKYLCCHISFQFKPQLIKRDSFDTHILVHTQQSIHRAPITPFHIQSLWKGTAP